MCNAIVFDFDSTLVDYHYSDDLAIAKVLSMLPKKIAQNEFCDYSVNVLLDIYNSGQKFDENIHKYRLKRTIEHYDLEWSDEYLEGYFDIYLNTVRVYDGAEDLLNKLSGKVKIGLLTNSIDPHEQRIRIKKSGIGIYFDIIGIASEIGSFKPNKEAFTWIADQLGVSANKCIFIGDSEKYDIEGSIKSGMKSIKRVKEKPHETMAHDCFLEYNELENILKIKYKLNI
jgi:putative hydrolase of the HAD superfamily